MFPQENHYFTDLRPTLWRVMSRIWWSLGHQDSKSFSFEGESSSPIENFLLSLILLVDFTNCVFIWLFNTSILSSMEGMMAWAAFVLEVSLPAMTYNGLTRLWFCCIPLLMKGGQEMRQIEARGEEVHLIQWPMRQWCQLTVVLKCSVVCFQSQAIGCCG